MELKPRGCDKVLRMVNKGVQVPNPPSLHAGDDCSVEQASATGAALYPGCQFGGFLNETDY